MSELEQLKQLLREVAELRTGLEYLRGCPLESSEIGALPEKVQDYLHQLDTIDEAILESARETIAALTKLNGELRKSLNTQ